ncbi:hypothetical protein LJC45_02110 [Alistipes sp. OttesenSCG-928-B03]|nr:hypothetical protein [Alistipes sp. OttesenSCG-928-B03]
MIAVYIDTKHQSVWLGQDYLLKYGVLSDTISKWCKRGYKCIYKDDRAFIDYDSIPAPTRAKLPTKEEIKAEYRASAASQLEQFFLFHLQNAYNGPGFVKWIEEIKATYQGLSPEKITECARRASVFERLLALQENNAGKGNLVALYNAYEQVYPGNYNRKNRFCMAIKKAREDGVLSVAVDKRALTKRPAQFGDEYKYLAEYILSHNKAFNITTS